MEQFTNILFEVYNGTSWVNISSDVLATPAPKCSRGIMSNGPIDRVAAPGTLTFSLNNSSSNSNKLEGYYSPGHSNSPSWWKVAARVRVRFFYDTWGVVKWQGFIDVGGIHVHPGRKSNRRVDVRCVDYMGVLRDHRIDLIQPTTNKTGAQALALIIANMPIKPSGTDFTTSDVEQMAYLFDNLGPETTALSEVKKVSDSQRLMVFVKGGVNSGEILTTAFNPDFSASFIPVATPLAHKLLLETGDGILLEDGTSYLLLDELHVNGDPDDTELTNDEMMEGTVISYGKHVVNFATVTSYPRKVDASADTVLWKLEKATQLSAGQSVTFRGQYRDPEGGNTKINGMDFVTPVSGTDYAAFTNSNGTGTNMTASMGVSATFGAAEVEITVTNNHGSTAFWFGGPDITFQVRGRGIYLYDPVRVVSEDATSIATYGVQPISVDLRYQEAPTGKSEIGQAIIATYKDPLYIFDRVVFVANRSPQLMACFMFVEPNMNLWLADTMTAQSARAWSVVGYEFEIFGKKLVRWTVITKYVVQ